MLTRIYRNIYVFQGVTDHPNAGPRRIVAAVFRGSVKGGTGHLACPAAVAFIDIHSYRFYYFLFFLTHDA
jgi:hypothetical protein